MTINAIIAQKRKALRIMVHTKNYKNVKVNIVLKISSKYLFKFQRPQTCEVEV